MNIHRALWRKDLITHLPILGIGWLLLLGAGGLALWPPWRVGLACWLGLIGPGLFAAIIAITYFAAEAGTGTELWLLTHPIHPRTVWWNRFMAVLALTLPAVGFVWWFVGYCRESLFVLAPAFGFDETHWNDLATYRGYGLLAYPPVLLLAVYAGSSSPMTRWAWVRFAPLAAFCPWLLYTVDAALEVEPLHWLFWAAWTAVGALLAGCGLRAFAGTAPQELGQRRNSAGRLARRAGLGWAVAVATIYGMATHVTSSDIVHLGMFFPQGHTLLSHNTLVRKWGLSMQRVFLVDSQTWTLRPTPLNPGTVSWHPTRPGVLVDRAPGLYRAPRLPRVREYDVATRRLRRVDIPALRAPWLRRARWVGNVQIDPITYDVVLEAVPPGEPQAHLFYLRTDGKTTHDLGPGTDHVGWNPQGRGFYFRRAGPKAGLFWWPYMEGKPRLIVANQRPCTIQFSPNGQWIAVQMYRAFYVSRYDGTEVHRVETGSGTVGENWDWQWSPDSRSLFLPVTDVDETRLVRYGLDTHRTDILASLPPTTPDRCFSLSLQSEGKDQQLLVTETLQRIERIQWTPLHQGSRVQYTSWLWIVDPVEGGVRSRRMTDQREEEYGRPDQQRLPMACPKERVYLGQHPDGRLLAQRGCALVALDPDTQEEEVIVRWGR